MVGQAEKKIFAYAYWKALVGGSKTETIKIFALKSFMYTVTQHIYTLKTIN